MENIYRLARKRMGISLKDAAECFLYVDYKTLWNYENDLIVPSEDMVFLMARIYQDPFLIIEHFYEKTQTGRLFRDFLGINLNQDGFSKIIKNFEQENCKKAFFYNQY